MVVNPPSHPKNHYSACCDQNPLATEKKLPFPYKPGPGHNRLKGVRKTPTPSPEEFTRRARVAQQRRRKKMT